MRKIQMYRSSQHRSLKEAISVGGVYEFAVEDGGDDILNLKHRDAINAIETSLECVGEAGGVVVVLSELDGIILDVMVV